MKLSELFKSWKPSSWSWRLIEPFILKLLAKNVPGSITKLYENLIKPTQPVIDSIFRLKEKIKKTPTQVDDYCFNEGLNLIETYANHLLAIVEQLKS